jgi:putative membrane protein
MARFLTDRDRDRIATAIRSVEARTKAELVAVVAYEAESYHHIPMLWAALVALALPPIVLFVHVPMTATEISLSQLAGFVVLAALGWWLPVRMALVPAKIKKARATRLAHEQFFVQRLHETEGRTGVLIFVAVAERHVEIIADVGISKLVGNEVWQRAVDHFVANVKAGRIAEGFIGAIEQCGGVLIGHFPADGRNPDELPDRLIEI